MKIEQVPAASLFSMNGILYQNPRISHPTKGFLCLAVYPAVGARWIGKGTVVEEVMR